MPTFAYRALTLEGERVAGRVDAADQHGAIQRLQAKGLIPIDAALVSVAAAGGDSRGTKGAKQVTQMSRELATLLGAGQPLEAALTLVLDEMAYKPLAAAMGRVLDKVRAGSSLSDAMGEERAFFPAVYVSMVRVGEAAGRLDSALTELATMRERNEALQSKLISALIYPVILMLVALGAVLILLTVVVPQMAPMFASAGSRLPANTRFVLAVADLVRNDGLWLLAAMALLGLLAERLVRRPAIGAAVDRALLRIPVVGTLLRERLTAQFCRSLATCLGGGLDLPQALAVSRDTLANRHARGVIEHVIGEVRTGRPLADSLATGNVLVPVAVKMLRAGEESGRLQAISGHLALAFEERVMTRLQRLVAVIEPAMVIVMGLLVGGIVTSILTAVLSVNELAL